MAEADLRIAQLDASSVSKIKALEQDIGKLVLALEPRVQVAKLQQAQLDRVQRLEKELGVILLAYEPA